MRKKSTILLGFIITVLAGSLLFWNFDSNSASAQIKDNTDIGVVPEEYNARDEFSLTQGGTTGVWNYGYSNSDTDHTFNFFTATRTSTQCGSSLFEDWYDSSNTGDGTPVISRNSSNIRCLDVPPEFLFVHPGPTGRRSVLRWTAPAAGTFQITGAFQRQNPSATTELKILKNAATPGEATLFTGNLGTLWQETFNFTVAVAAGDKIDFSVGFGNGSYVSDGSLIAVTIGQPVTACLNKPADLAVWTPGENSPTDVESPNTNASLAGNASYANMGKVGRAFAFDGSGDYVRIEDNAAQRPADQITLEGWFKFNSTGGIVSLVGKPLRDSPFNSYALYLENGYLRGLVGNASQYTRVHSNFSPPTGVWHHLAFTYQFTGGVSVLKLYANGVEVTSGQDGTPNLPLAYDANPYPLLVGGDYENNTPGYYLNGQADEVSLYGRALSQDELFNLTRQGSFGKCPNAPCAQTPQGLVSWYQGEQNALDSRSNNHGALQNGATFVAGKVGQSFSFDGVDDHILIADPMPPSLQLQNDISLNAWIYVTQYPTGEGLGMIVGSQYDVTSSGASIFLDARTNPDGQTAPPGHIHFQIGDGSFHATNSQTAVPLNQWVHISANRKSGENARIYYNGVLQPSTSAPWSGTITYNGAWFAIGQQKDINRPFKGLIDEVSVFSRSLTQTEVQSIVNADSAGMCKPGALNPAANQIAWLTGDGETVDFLGLNPPGILRGNTNYKIGKVGQSFNFDGSGDYVEIPDDPDHRPTSQLTIEGWFKFNAGGAASLVSKPFTGSTANSYTLFVENNRIQAGYGTTSTFVRNDTGVVPRLGEWYHLAYTVNPGANTHTVYINGQPFVQNSTQALTYEATPQPLLIGAEFEGNTSGAFFLNGQADEVSLYAAALTASEIQAIYNAGVAGKLKSVFTPADVIRSSESETGKGQRAETVSSPQAVTVDLSSASVTFDSVTQAGTTSQSNVDLAFLPKLPAGMTFTGLAYDISTTAVYSGDVEVCFNVPALSSMFANLQVLHLENGVWQFRTTTRSNPVICSEVSSLSPFVIVDGIAPTAARASVGGRVVNLDGVGLPRVIVTLTDTAGHTVSTITNSFGYYRFEEVGIGETYVVAVQSKHHQFSPPAHVLNLSADTDDVNFTSVSGMLKPPPAETKTR